MFDKFAEKFSFVFLLRACWRLGDRRQLAGLYLFVVVSAALNTLEPLVQGKFIAALTRGGDRLMQNLVSWLTALMVLNLARGLSDRRSGMVEARYGFEIRARFTEQLYRKIVGLPWQWHGTQHSGTTTAKLNDASQALFNFAHNQAFFAMVILVLAGNLIALTILAPLVGLTVALAAYGITVMFRRSDKRIVTSDREAVKAEQFLSTGIIDYLGNIGTVISLRLQRHSELEVMRRLGLMRQRFEATNRARLNKNFFLGFVQGSFGLGVILLYVSMHRTSETAVLVGSSVAILRYLVSIEGNVNALGWLQQSLLRNKAQIASVDDIEEAYSRRDVTSAGTQAGEWRNIQLAELHFRYEDREHQVHQLADVSLRLHHGQRVALVGSSGSGKSTLLRLLRGLHQPVSGTLTLDGVAAEFAALAAVSTLIPQDAETFENTLRYNISFGVEAADAEVRPVVDMACLGPVIAPLPQGLDTDIRERGVNLSGGQKQRLALARGLFAARDSSLLLMDEPTSSLDPITEAEIFTRIFAALPDTCIVAAIHRLHLLDRFDYIYVMENGGIIEEGTLPDLLARGGTLERLWAAQKREEQSTD